MKFDACMRDSIIRQQVGAVLRYTGSGSKEDANLSDFCWCGIG